VILMRCTWGNSSSSPGLPAAGLVAAICGHTNRQQQPKSETAQVLHAWFVTYSIGSYEPMKHQTDGATACAQQQTRHPTLSPSQSLREERSLSLRDVIVRKKGERHRRATVLLQPTERFTKGFTLFKLRRAKLRSSARATEILRLPYHPQLRSAWCLPQKGLLVKRLLGICSAVWQCNFRDSA